MLVANELGNEGLLVGSQGIGGCEPVGDIRPEEDGRALALIIAKVGPMLLVADQRGQIRAERARHLRRISEPLVFVGLEPSQTVADDRSAADLPARIAASPVECGPERQSAEPGSSSTGNSPAGGSGSRARLPWLAGHIIVAPFSRV